MKKKNSSKGLYIVADLVVAYLVWVLVNVIRFYEQAQFEGFLTLGKYLVFPQVIKGQILVPLFWIALYALAGYYNKPRKKSTLSILGNTFITTTIGVIFVFFYVVLNDLPYDFIVYYKIFFAYFTLQFIATFITRFILHQREKKLGKIKGWITTAVVIGNGSHADNVKNELKLLDCKVLAQVNENLDNLQTIVKQQHVDELIVAVDHNTDEQLLNILYSLYPYNLPVKIRPDKNNLLSKAKVTTIHGIPFIEVNNNNFSEAAKNIKWVMDKIIAATVLLLLAPLYAYIYLKVKHDSNGPAIFKQQRIGFMGKPFTIYKFRTMNVNNNQQQPILTGKNDTRVTNFGKILRKYRLDELPQFWNVLKGDMAVVGPRPEQKYYIEQIVKKAPYYYLLHNVKPGITSWGMVKYGYAENVEQMIQRLDYDIMYYENMSLALDITILVYTIKIIVTGKGV